MRTYLYISDSKVAQFVGQLGKERKTKLAAKLGVAVGVLTAGVSAEAEWKHNRITLLEAAEKLIRDEEPIGPLDSDDPWIEGTADIVGETFEDERGGTDLLFTSRPIKIISLVLRALPITPSARLRPRSPTTPSHICPIC